MRQKPEFFSILRTLANHKVDYIVVGGVAILLHGAPCTTFDLDVVHSTNPDNIDRLLSALQELGASTGSSRSGGSGPTPHT